MPSLGSLTLVGEPRPAPFAQWSAGALAMRELMSPELVELLRQWGPGRLCGTFELPDPTTDDCTVLRARVLAWHRHGYWPGLAPKPSERLAIIARDRRGAGLAYGDAGYVVLGPRGEVFQAGRTLDELVATFMCKFLHMTYDVRIGGHLDTFIELGAEPVYVASAAPGLPEYIENLRVGRDDLLEAALTSEPLILAYVRTVAALCGPISDKVEDSIRQDALDTVLRLAKRREPLLFGLVFPETLSARAPFHDDAVRAWATSDLELSAKGPLLAEPPSGGEPVVVARRRDGEGYWPHAEPSQWVSSIVQLWSGTALEPIAVRYAELARGLPASASRTAIGQIEQLDAHRTYVKGFGDGTLGYDQRLERADAAEARIRDLVAEGCPLLALAVMGHREAVCVRATRLLAGVRDAKLSEMWLRLLLATEAPMPWGADAYAFAQNYAASTHVDDRLVDLLLAPLKDGSPIAAILVCSRIDRDDVFSALLDQYVLSLIHI